MNDVSVALCDFFFFTFFKIILIIIILLSVVSDARDVDSKEKIADLETKIVELGKQNAGLKNKVPYYDFSVHCF